MIEKKIQNIQKDIQRIIERCDVHVNSNLPLTEQTAIKELSKQENITITRSDKGGEMVVMKASHLKELCLEHLGDTTTYEKLKKDPSDALRLKVNKTLKGILTKHDFSTTFINNLQTPTTARTQHFYGLPKTHKTNLKIRPIVSACGGIFDRLGWFLQQLLKPLLSHVKAHLNSTTDLLARFNAIEESKLSGTIPISFDVVSLYTNINVEEAIETSLEYALKHKLNLYGLRTDELFELLHLILDNNIFEYANTPFKQIRGLAMGNRLSGTLAILTMDRFECKYIYPVIKPTIYVRYVDDIGTTVQTIEEAHETLHMMNSKHPTLRFELEAPDAAGFLPILDLKIKINVDGSMERKLYTKPANKGITLNYRSHHPSSTKLAVTTNEFDRTLRCSSEEHVEDAVQTTRKKLTANGTPAHVLDRSYARVTKRGKEEKKKNDGKVKKKTPALTLKIPFVSDQINHQIQRTLAKHDVPARVVNPRGKTINDLVKCPARNGSVKTCNSKICAAPSLCQRSNVVYIATCSLCGKDYIGMTARKLHDRAREHMLSARKKDDKTALGEHYRDCHAKVETPSINFQIIKHQPDLLRLHIEEAIAIQKFNPALNRRRETLGTGFLP